MFDRLRHLPDRTSYCLLAVAGVTLGSYVVGYAVGSRWLLPLLNTIPAYALMVVLLRRSQRRRAVATMLLWAMSLAVVGTSFAYFFPERAEQVTINGRAYREPMIHWLRTGEGEEGQLSEFLPRHARELALYIPVGVLTAGAGAILMGAVLMNFMDFFVAGAASVSSEPLTTAVLAWFPWSVVRVIGYVVLGVIAAEPALSRWPGSTKRWNPPWRWVAAALACLVADVAIKVTIAPGWGRMVGAYLL